MTLKDKIIELISKDSLAYNKPDNLFLFLSSATGEDLGKIKREFNSLISNGDLFETRRGKFIALPSRGFMKGKFIGNNKGYGFCDTGAEDDVFIPSDKTNGAIDGDMVIIKYAPTTNGVEGEIVSIYKPIDRIVGTIEKISKNYFIDPDDGKINVKFLVKLGGIKFNENDKVVARISRDKNIFRAEIIENLGPSDDVKTLELGIIRNYDLYEEFPNEVIEASEKIPQTVLEKQKKNRLDLTNEVMFTIDGEDAKDFDDAVSIKRTKTGYTLGVHIADVGEYVKQNSIIDEEAFKRGTSVYFPRSVLPMLPVSLSNGICSLNENVERLCLSCIMDIDHEGVVRNHKICESVIKSNARLTYNEVYATITGSKPSKADKFKEDIMTMVELAEILEKNQFERGGLNLEIPEPQFVFDSEGYVIDVEKRERNISHKLIEQFMILANETVSKEFKLKGFPFVYRVHEAPREEKLKSVWEFMRGLGVKVPDIPEEITPDFYQKLLDLVKGQPYEETVSKVMLRSMQKARYDERCLGHFGLALTYYCHFTSPIRRYPDLTIHRFIKESLHKKINEKRMEEITDFAKESALQSSETEISADKAERDVDDLWKCYLMRDRVGEVFEGVITGVNSYGFYVGLYNSCEGLVKIETLPLDNYLFFEKSMMLKGARFTYKIGDRVRVKLIAANLYTRKIDFELEL